MVVTLTRAVIVNRNHEYCAVHTVLTVHTVHKVHIILCAVHQPVPGLWIEEQCWPDMWPGASLPLGAACVEIVAIVPLPLTTPAPRPGHITHPTPPRQVPGPGNQYNIGNMSSCHTFPNNYDSV